MKFRYGLALVSAALLILGLTACGSATPTPRPTPTNAPPTAVPTQSPPTATATQPPTATPTQTPVPVQSTAKQDVNTRKGPGLEYSIAQKMNKGTQAIVLGKNADGKWLQIAFPDAANPSWVSETFLTVTGPKETLQVIQVAAAPTATRSAAVPTKAAAATATISVPAPHGGLGFVFYEEGSISYVLGNISVESHNTSGFLRLGGPRGAGPFDVNQSTSVAPFSWAPDGSKLAFVFNQGGSPAPDILKYAKPGSFDSPTTLDSHRCISSPIWEDSKTLLYIGMDDNNCTTQLIYKISTDPGIVPNDRQFFRARPGESLRGLAWGPFILFVSNLGGAQEIWRMNQDGSGPIAVTSDGRENGAPAWSPDGKSFAYYSKQADGTYQIITRNADGSNPRKLTNTNHNFSPVWSQDSNWIAFMSDRGGRADIYIMDKNGGRVQLLTDKSAVGGASPGSWR